MEELSVKSLFSLLSIAALSLALVACGEQQKAPEVAKPSAQAPAPAPAAPPTASPAKSGKVTETMNAAGYTYVQVDTGTEKFWAAAPETAVKAGDTVAVPEGMPMPNFQSKALNRTFDVVYFVPGLMVNGATPAGSALPPGHPTSPGMPPMGSKSAPSGAPAMPPTSAGAPKVTAPAGINLNGIAKADQTIAEIYTQKAALAGKAVKIRGKVVKFSPDIMGKN